jgi:hypothetical protein
VEVCRQSLQEEIMNSITVGEQVDIQGGVSLIRIYLLRSLYLVWAVGLAIKVWPRFLPPDLSIPVMNTVVNSVLAGLSLTALLGVIWPLRMLPLMLFEVAWKSIWLVAVGVPLWQAGPFDAQTAEVFKSIAMVVLFFVVIPWRYAIAQYFCGPADRWK